MPLYKQKVRDEPAKVSICLDFSSLILMDSLPLLLFSLWQKILTFFHLILLHNGVKPSKNIY